MLDFRGLIEKALAALESNRPADAEKAVRSALSMSPRDDQLLHLLGVSLIDQQRPEEAIEALQRAISLNRRDAEYHNALGVALRYAGRVAESVVSIERALKLDPALGNGRYNLALSLQAVGDFARAERMYRELMAANPADIEAIGSLSNMQWLMGEHEAAMQTLREGLVTNPSSGDMRFRLGEQLLSLGRYEEGWFLYLWRINRHALLRQMGLAFDSPQLMAPFPARLDGETVRVHSEQGLGDDLYFLRFAAQLRARGARVHAVVPARLGAMVARSGAVDVTETAAVGALPEGRARLLGDLPHALGSHAVPLPATLRFPPLEAQSRAIAERLAGFPRPFIGLTWRAGTGRDAGHKMALFKAVPFPEFVAGAAALPGTLVVLQREPRAGEVERLEAACPGRVLDCSALNADLESMHALLAQLDDYIGVSNTNMHLCAALGRGARVLVSRGSEFRWMASGAESPWFPGFSIYRQETGGDWTAPLGAAFQAAAQEHN